MRVSRAGDTRRIRIGTIRRPSTRVLAGRGSDGAFSALIARYTHGASRVTYRHFGERFVYVRSGEGRARDRAARPTSCARARFVHYSSHQEHSLRVTSDDAAGDRVARRSRRSSERSRPPAATSRGVSAAGCARAARRSGARWPTSRARPSVSVSYLSAVEQGTNMPVAAGARPARPRAAADAARAAQGRGPHARPRRASSTEHVRRAASSTTRRAAAARRLARRRRRATAATRRCRSRGATVFVFVERGALLVEVDGAPHALGQGDALDAVDVTDMRWESLGELPAVSVWGASRARARPG